MKYLAAVLPSSVLVVTALTHMKPCAHTKESLKCVKYVSNYDGDTIKFSIPKMHPIVSPINIRLQGVDTAEIRTKDKCERRAALKAKKLVESKLEGAKVIHLERIKRGKFFRIVADVIYDGRSLSEDLKKLSYPYFGGKKQKIDWCKL